MGLFKRKREEKQHWLEEVEQFANYYGDLKLDMESAVNEAMEGNYDVASFLWDDKWGDYERGCAYFYVLGVLEGIANELSRADDEEY